MVVVLVVVECTCRPAGPINKTQVFAFYSSENSLGFEERNSLGVKLIFIPLSQISDSSSVHNLVILHVLYVLYDWYIERMHGMVDRHGHSSPELEMLHDKPQ